jgi:orotate phosphoribosyltransferase
VKRLLILTASCRLDGGAADAADAICAREAEGLGRNVQIEGHLKTGARVLLVGDMTTDGRSKVNFCNALRDAGATIEHCFVVFFYDLFPEGRKILSDLAISLHALATWWDELEAAKRSGRYDQGRLADVEAFMKDPVGWSKAHGGAAQVKGSAGCRATS